jgi:tetratricopeptide (TPR) repeat protein
MPDLDDPLDDDDDEFPPDDELDDDFSADDSDQDDESIGRLPGDEMYGAGLEAEVFHDPDEGLPPEQAASRRAMYGVPNNFDDEDEEPSPTRAMQDAIIDQVNDILEEDEADWDKAAERAYDALTIDPTYGRAANAILRCYLTHATLDDMHHLLLKLFHPEDEAPNESHRVRAYSYRILSHADLWAEWDENIPPEIKDVAESMEQGRAAIHRTYFSGGKADYRKAKEAFAIALDRAHDRAAVMWYLARLYADKGFFADSAALLGALLSGGSINPHVQRLYAEMLWWREQSRWLPWVH